MNRSRFFIDVGNSRIKIGTERSGEFDPLLPMFETAGEVLRWIQQNHSGEEEIVICSVVKGVLEKLRSELSHLPLRVIENESIPRKYLDYHTPETLGVDRFLACLGAASLSHSDVIVVDAGTACTIDYMTHDYVFHGGVIMPGLSTLKRSIQISLPALPPFESKIPKEFPGKSSVESLQWGTIEMFRNAVRDFIGRLHEPEEDPVIWLTGGDARMVNNLLDKDYPVQQKLVFEGMRLFCDLVPDQG
jgi:type III pantothenate kinase